jgi:hypothetical protein
VAVRRELAHFQRTTQRGRVKKAAGNSNTDILNRRSWLWSEKVL